MATDKSNQGIRERECSTNVKFGTNKKTTYYVLRYYLTYEALVEHFLIKVSPLFCYISGLKKTVNDLFIKTKNRLTYHLTVTENTAVLYILCQILWSCYVYIS